MKRAVLGLAALAALGCNDFAAPKSDASKPPTSSTSTMEKPSDTPFAEDNTGLNARDSDGALMTPFDQGNTAADLAVTADIRKQIVGTSLSVSAQNVKIMTQEGKVTLRGPVATDSEKRRVEQVAGNVAGEGNVTSELQVATK